MKKPKTGLDHYHDSVARQEDLAYRAGQKKWDPRYWEHTALKAIGYCLHFKTCIRCPLNCKHPDSSFALAIDAARRRERDTCLMHARLCLEQVRAHKEAFRS